MMHTRFLAVALAGGAALVGCGGGSDFPTNKCSQITTGTCVEIAGGDAAALQTAANSVSPNTTIILGEGTFVLTNAVTIRTDGVSIIGQGIDETVLEFSTATAQINGIDVIGDDFLVQDITVLDAKKDGIRVEDSDGVVFRRIRATWTTPSLTTNGAYGIYPVKSRNVLVEDSFAENASDAGLYVGQCQNVIVRNNTVRGNVAGLEIENTQYADVYGNTAEDNTAGIVVFDLPGNPIVGRDVRLRDNFIRGNNHVNFAVPGTTVAAIPVGTGTFAMASRRVEITGNAYANNNTFDIAVVSGLIVESMPATWALSTASLVGDWEDLGLESGGPGVILNFRSENIVVANNTHSNSGTSADFMDPMMLGFLLDVGFGEDPISNVLYDSVEETFNSTDPLMNTNNNHICVGGNTMGTFASLNLEGNADAPPFIPFFRPAAPFAPYDCTTLDGGPVAPVVLP